LCYLVGWVCSAQILCQFQYDTVYHYFCGVYSSCGTRRSVLAHCRLAWLCVVSAKFNFFLATNTIFSCDLRSWSSNQLVKLCNGSLLANSGISEWTHSTRSLTIPLVLFLLVFFVKLKYFSYLKHRSKRIKFLYGKLSQRVPLHAWWVNYYDYYYSWTLYYFQLNI